MEPLACYQKTDSDKGSVTDSAADQVVITAITLSLMYMGNITAISGSIYVLLYSVVAILAIIRNNLDIPYLSLISPRFIVYYMVIVRVLLFTSEHNIFNLVV
jgi:phosphatidylglycerophosphate synthase